MDGMYGLHRGEGRMGMRDTALICLSGHVINDCANRHPEFNKQFCDT
jgi:hypothetical protein